MRVQGENIGLSASDLARHLGCRHLTRLDLAAAKGERQPPRWRDPILEVLQQRGFEHENRYLEHLRERGLEVVDVHADDRASAADRTVAAMREGAEVISQATLACGEWFGRADILRRVPTTSALGAWSYEVVDTKLARETRAGTLLQLCLYSDLLRSVQRRMPDTMHVVSPGAEFVPESFRVNDYFAYYRFVRRRLRAAVRGGAGDSLTTSPEPVPQCDLCRWWPDCEKWRRDQDHLSLVAGISKLQRRELETWGVGSLTELAGLLLPLRQRPKRGATEGYVRVREQARLQLESRQLATPVYELLPREPERGLARLPEPSHGDIFFDIEGDPFFGSNGLEYLLGWAALKDTGPPEYHARWALGEIQEREAFEAFVDYATDRWARFPELHVFHFAPYEPAALKRLMGRYASREEEVDRMLRAGLFVDLHSITRQSLRAGVEGYSIKDLEALFGYKREVELREASISLRAFERALELGQVEAVPEDIRGIVEGYNRDDCVSTLHLRNWLEGLRSQLIEAGELLERPRVEDGEPSEAVGERHARVLHLMAELLREVPAEKAERTDDEHGRWLLAHMLGWHDREEKAPWWDFFRLASLGEEELLEEDLAIGGLDFEGTVGGTKRCPVHRYRFAPQETKVRPEDSLRQTGGEPLGSVADIDLLHRTIDIKKRSDSAALHPGAVFAHSIVVAREQAAALFRLGEWVAADGIDGPGDHRAARDLLLVRRPRLASGLPEGAALGEPGEPTLATACRLASDLSGGVLAIQGPPGAGKTYTGARMIRELVKTGRKIGITATSHKVIRNLLDEAVGAAAESNLTPACIQKVSGKAEKYAGQPIRETTRITDVVQALEHDQVQIAAGTAWLWAREELFESVDVLFVDEAAQMSLANVLAVTQAATNLVLLGDPQQLEQPLLGSHPEGTEVSALTHLLAGRQTMPSDRGLFLAETWRLPPSLCTLTSELFYDSRLESRPDLALQELRGASPFEGAGAWYVPVEHRGNQNSSLEEADRVAQLHAELLTAGLTWIDREENEGPITEDDILIVAPYNAHVGLLGERLPSARIGTVDKFQGQQAPIVIYSMATSSPEEAPRGMEFLFSPNRLNVATSRARCVCILVANPRLFEPECRTPREMRLANAFCRYLEVARVL